MSNINAIPIEEQVYLLNRELISKADTLNNAVITVGGQAVQYWVSRYIDNYGDNQPDAELVTSIDVDYSARKSDIKALADALNIDSSFNEDGQPPSLARFILVDKTTKNIKQVGDRYFTEPDTNFPNTVDIIDRPAGFDFKDFTGNKLKLNTEPFSVTDPETGLSSTHEKIRVLNPIACMQSRFKNITALQRRTEIEVARITALLVPVYYFLIEQFDAVDRVPEDSRRAEFSKAMKHLDVFFRLANERMNMRVQTAHDIKLYRIFEFLMCHFRDHQNDYNFNENFWKQDLSTKYHHLQEKYQRINKL